MPGDFILFFMSSALLYHLSTNNVLKIKVGGSGTLSAVVLFPAELSVVLGVLVGDTAKGSSVEAKQLLFSACCSPLLSHTSASVYLELPSLWACLMWNCLTGKVLLGLWVPGSLEDQLPLGSAFGLSDGGPEQSKEPLELRYGKIQVC